MKPITAGITNNFQTIKGFFDISDSLNSRNILIKECSILWDLNIDISKNCIIFTGKIKNTIKAGGKSGLKLLPVSSLVAKFINECKKDFKNQCNELCKKMGKIWTLLDKCS